MLFPPHGDPKHTSLSFSLFPSSQKVLCEAVRLIKSGWFKVNDWQSGDSNPALSNPVLALSPLHHTGCLFNFDSFKNIMREAGEEH